MDISVRDPKLESFYFELKKFGFDGIAVKRKAGWKNER